MKGGYSAVGHSYARANHPAMGDDFKKDVPQSCIVALDANNQYGESCNICI